MRSGEEGEMTVGKICMRDTVVATRGSNVTEIAKLMRTHHVGDVIIVEERAGAAIPIGIVTDRDLVMEILAQELAPDAVTAGDIMSYEMLTVRESDGIWDALQQMRTKGVRRVPVVNDKNALVGIVTLDDMLELLTDELAELAKTIRREQQREHRARR
jgi:CBS domain-containing protein